VDRLEFRRVLNAAGANAVITLDIEGDKRLTFVRDIQIHPIKDTVQHIDFLLVDAKQRVTVEVPIVLVGEAVELGREGGILEQLMNAITVDAPVVSIPRQYEVDVTEVTLDNSVRVSDIDLGEGVTTEVDLEAPIATGSISKATLSEDLDEGEIAEGEVAEGDEVADTESAED
ncbi:MAG: 50S ribosomal protein L25, partial [Actinomycetia bacterium]|nr:50S ribosomal protein L25 [Actinomycetes bacterium]